MRTLLASLQCSEAGLAAGGELGRTAVCLEGEHVGDAAMHGQAALGFSFVSTATCRRSATGRRCAAAFLDHAGPRAQAQETSGTFFDAVTAGRGISHVDEPTAFEMNEQEQEVAKELDKAMAGYAAFGNKYNKGPGDVVEFYPKLPGDGNGPVPTPRRTAKPERTMLDGGKFDGAMTNEGILPGSLPKGFDAPSDFDLNMQGYIPKDRKPPRMPEQMKVNGPVARASIEPENTSESKRPHPSGSTEESVD
eukprot:CAMPEP_0117540578 /NCGR_PEP_ID=MMETSP0784-20121206/43572_1 /TAXON_ID=39447 /ORGANISM="" /LENGTH=249 /DNA_ID=CAMNT_0005337239 /DNA_START=111 /DNA_END=860 /DNA_ORIENTATION=-